jgi:diaminopimelate decarboxylase
VPRILGSAHLVLDGIASHIGSQIGSLAAMREAVAITAAFARECREAGAPVRMLDAGGGWPVAYGDEDEPFPGWLAFGGAIRDGIADGGAADLGLLVAVEPGRALVADACVLLTRVLYVRTQHDKTFVVVDAAMNDLIRPSLYEAHHAIDLVRPAPPDAPRAPVDVVGPVCESGDFLALGRPMPPVVRDDLLAIRTAGAYGMSMASNYNSRPRAPEILVDGGAFRVIRERETIDDLLARERP